MTQKILIIAFVIACQIISLPQDFDGLILTDDKVVSQFMEVD